MNHIDNTNCFECGGNNTQCIENRKYVEQNGICIYRNIADTDIQKFFYQREGKITLYNMLMDYLGKLCEDKVKGLHGYEREKMLKKEGSKILYVQRKKDKDETQDVALSGATKLGQMKKINIECKAVQTDNHFDVEDKPLGQEYNLGESGEIPKESSSLSDYSAPKEIKLYDDTLKEKKELEGEMGQ